MQGGLVGSGLRCGRDRAAEPPLSTPARQGALVVSSLAVLLLVAYWRVIVGGETFILHDYLTYTLPSRAHLVDALSHFRFPQWWSGVGLGAPFAANPNHCALYPPAWIAAFFPGTAGADAVLLLHMFWLGIGGAFLARRLGADTGGALFAGGALMVSGFATSMAVNSLPPLALAWMPWLAGAADGLARASGRLRTWRAAAIVALCAAMQLLVGEPAAAITSVLLASAITVLRSSRRALALARFATALGFALLLASISLLPAVGLLFESRRATGIAMSEASVWSMHPWRLLELLWPRILGNPGDPVLNAARAVADTGSAQGLDTSFALSFYAGAPTLLFAAIAMRRRLPSARALGLVSLVFLFIALGAYTPFYEAFRTVVLPERLVRYPQRHFAGALILWTTLAGVGLTRVLQSEDLANRAARASWYLAAALGGIAVASHGMARSLGGGLSKLGQALAPPLDGARIVSGAIQGAALAAGVLAVVALCLHLRGRGHLRLATVGICVAVFAGLVSEVWWLHPMLPRASVAGRPALLALVPPGAEPRPRLYRSPGLMPASSSTEASIVALGLHHTAYENVGARFGIDHFPGWDPAHSARLAALWSKAAMATHGSRILELYGIDYAIVGAAEAKGSLRPLAATPLGDIVIARNELRRPRGFVAPRWKRLASDAEAESAIFASTLDDGEIRISDPLRGSSPAATQDLNASPAPCAMHAVAPEKVRLVCRAPFAGYAVLLDAFWPGWSATVDGSPIPIERADLLGRAVPISAGTHTIEFAYATPGLRLGACISFPAWAILAVVLIRTRQRRAIRDARP